MTRKDRDKIKAMLDKLRATASFESSIPSKTVFELTDPIMKYIELSALPNGRKLPGNSRS